jgi:hypothetical protein
LSSETAVDRKECCFSLNFSKSIPQRLKPHPFLLDLFGTAKQAAEKGLSFAQSVKKHPSGAKQAAEKGPNPSEGQEWALAGAKARLI